MMKKLFMAMSLATVMALSVGCSNTANSATDKTTTTEATTAQTTDNSQQSEDSTDDQNLTAEQKQQLNNLKSKGTYPQLSEMKKGETVATISTNMGDIKVRFFPEYAPKAVENFVTHAKEGYYDGVIFHRVIDEFMIQGGDPNGTGTGGESIWGEPFEVEANADLKHIRGALCMAKTSEPISIGSQFYIVQNDKLDDNSKAQIESIIEDQETEFAPGYKVKDFYPAELMKEYLSKGGTPTLDMQYTVFGQVYEGLDVVDKIAKVETDDNDKPKTEVKINKVTVSEY